MKIYTLGEQNEVRRFYRTGTRTDKETADRILSLVPEELMKKIPFFVRKHANTRTVKRISVEYPELYAAAQQEGEWPEKEKEELRKVITNIFQEKMNKHSIR